MFLNKKTAYLLVNFGGPRDLDEVRPFLTELLTDRDVIQTHLPKFLHDLIFKRVAKKRSKKVKQDYKEIGGKSPIYFDTEKIRKHLKEKLKAPVLTFHRYLPQTHADFIQSITSIDCDEIVVFPMFPQFTFATTGSIARWLKQKLPSSVEKKLKWVKSYAGHPAFVHAWQKKIEEFLFENKLGQKSTTLLFSAHGVPRKFIEQGDPYQAECEKNFSLVMEPFECQGILAYQSQFGKEEWIRPYTSDVSRHNYFFKKNVVFVPISFTSDHIETLFEIENDYMPLVKNRGFQVFRVPALNFDSDWLYAILKIIQDAKTYDTESLIRN